MARSQAATASEPSTGRSNPIDLTPAESRSILAGWQGIYHLFGGRWEKITTDEGNVTIKGFSTYEKYDPRTLVKDTSGRERRLDFAKIYPYIMGNEPAPFESAEEMTAFLVQFFRGSVEEGTSRSPKYAKEAVQEYKIANGLYKKKGPRPKFKGVISLDNLDTFDPEQLADVDPKKIEALQSVLEQAINKRKEPATAGAVS